MNHKRMENYKKLSEAADVTINAETIKLFEYESLLREQQKELSKTFFIKRLFDKNKKESIKSLKEYISASTKIIKTTKDNLEKEKNKFLQSCIDDHINADKSKVQLYYKLNNDHKEKQSICDIHKGVYETGKNTISWISSAINSIKEMIECEFLNGNYDHLFITDINHRLVNSLKMITYLKQQVNFVVTQIEAINPHADVTVWEHVKKALDEERSEYITIRESKRHIKSLLADINKTYATIQVAQNMIINETNKWVRESNNALSAFNSFWDEIKAEVMEDIENYVPQEKGA